MNASAPRPRVRVESVSPDEYRIRITDRAGVGNDELVELLLGVYRKVNPAAALESAPPAVIESEDFKRLYREGPVLFNVVGVDAQTGRPSEKVEGLKVSAQRLQATLDELRTLGFTVAD